VHLHATPPYPSSCVSLLNLLHLVLRRSPYDAGAADLPLASYCARALSKLTIYVFLLYSTPAHGQPVFDSITRCGAPTHLVPCCMCLPMLSCSSLVYVCGLGVCPFSGLVCDLLLRCGRELSHECALPEESLGHNLDEHCLEDTRVVWCSTYPSGGAPLHWALRSLGVSET